MDGWMRKDAVKTAAAEVGQRAMGNDRGDAVTARIRAFERWRTTGGIVSEGGRPMRRRCAYVIHGQSGRTQAKIDD